MTVTRMPALPEGYAWSIFSLADGRSVIEILFEQRDVIAYAFQPKRRRCWYLSGDRLGHTLFAAGKRPQCATWVEACNELAEWAKAHCRYVSDV